MVRTELAKIPAQRQEEFLEDYKRKAKSAGLAYLLWLLLGWHYIYLRKWGIQFLFWLTFGGLLIWWLIDLFRIAGLVRDYNKDVAVDVLRNLKAGAVERGLTRRLSGPAVSLARDGRGVSGRRPLSAKALDPPSI